MDFVARKLTKSRVQRAPIEDGCIFELRYQRSLTQLQMCTFLKAIFQLCFLIYQIFGAYSLNLNQR